DSRSDTARSGCDGRPGAGGVGVRVLHHIGDVGVGPVVGEHRVPPVGGVGQVAAVGAQVAGGGQRGVVQAVRVGDAVAVAVGAPLLPGGGDELHRADGAVPAGVAVVLAAIGVGDGRGVVRAVQRDADD